MHFIWIGSFFLPIKKNINMKEIVYTVEIINLPQISLPVERVKETQPIQKEIQAIKNVKTPLSIGKNEKFEISPRKEISFSQEEFIKNLSEKLAKTDKKISFKEEKTSSLKIPKIEITKENTSSQNPFIQNIEIPEWYLSQIKNIIKKNWKSERFIYSLSAMVSFRLFPDGKVDNVMIEKSSGNISFDNSTIEAIKKVKQFPSFPEQINQNYLDIVIEFTTEG